MSANLVPFTADGGIVTNGDLVGVNASPAPNISGFNSISSVDIGAIGNITAGGNIDIDGEGTIGGNLTIVGNVNFSGGGTINQITSPFGYFTGNADGSNALYAGVPGGTIVPNAVAQFTGDANAYMQVNMQNKNHGTQASIEYVITGDLGTDTQDYLDIGFSSSSWDGTQTNSLGNAVAPRDGYIYVQGGGGGGNLVIGTTTPGTKVKFNVGGPDSTNTVMTLSNTALTVGNLIVMDNLDMTGNSISNISNASGNNANFAHFNGDGGGLSNIQIANISGLGNISTINLTGSSSNVLYGNGVFAPAPGSSVYGDSNVVTLLGAFGSNTVSTTGNVTAGNLKTSGNVLFTANTSNIVFNTTAYINGSGNSVGRDGSILLQPYTGAGSTFPGVIIGGAGRLIAPNGSVHQVFNTSDVTFQVPIKNIVGSAATSTTTGSLQITGGGGFTGNVYVGGSLVRTGPITQAAWTTGGVGLKLPTATYTDNSTAAGTQASSYVHLVDAPALAFSNAVTVTNAATMYVAAPTASTNATITNGWAIVANGNVQVNGTGGISIPNLPAFRVYGNGTTTALSTTQNGTGILNGNNWAVDYNQGAYLNSTTGVFTAPVAGLYVTNLNARVVNNTNPSAQIAIVKNYATTNVFQAMWETGANSSVNHFGVGTTVKLAAGDTLVIRVTVGTITFDVNDSWSVAYLG